MMAHEIRSFHTFFHFVGDHITPVASGESHNEREVTFLVACKADRKVFLYLQGYIIFGVFRRFSILIGINAEQGEVTCMARPHPVVGICTKLTYGRRRCTYHADITIRSLDEQIVTVSAIESFQLQFASRSQGNALFGRKTFGHFFQVLGREIIGTIRVRIYLQLFVDVISHIQYLINISDGKSLAGKFFFTAHGPETIRQIVVFHRTVLLDRTIATVVVGQYQSFGRDDFTCTPPTEVDHCVFQCNAVGVINLVSWD